MPELRPSPSRWAGILAAAVLLHLLLIQPNHPDAATWGAFRFFPHELPLTLLLLATLPPALRPAARILVTAFLTAMAAVKLADLSMQTALFRPFNPALDLPLLAAGLEMLGGALGLWPGLLAAAAAAVLLALAGAIWWATGRIAALAPPPQARLLLLPALALIAAEVAHLPGIAPPGEPFTLRLAWEHARDARQARRDLAAFRLEAGRDPHALPADGRALGALAGHDILLIFTESYGRTALDNPRYAPTIRATLAAAEAPLAAAGLAARSAYLASPVVGGQSWLAHATLLAGLNIDSQGRYRALVASPRRTLGGLAAEAGWHSAAVVPAVTRAWPEAAFFGHSTVLAASGLGYAGQPFNWVTMPDQFTLAAFERILLEPVPRAPVFAEIVLISSHAPWTPIPPRLPWDSMGDGRVFDPYAGAGDPPQVVWRDPDRVRDQFGQALDYSLATALGFTERRASSAPLVILLGDHQPAAFVHEGFGGSQVPVHLIGPPALLALTGGWGWTEGLVPDAGAPVWPMAAFRDRFLDAFAAGLPVCGGTTLHPGPQPLPTAPSC